jgi:AraC-like DNA-binding protein
VRRGREEVSIGRGRIVVDEDAFLILNPGTVYATRIRSAADVFSLSIHFADALVADVLGWLDDGSERLREPGERTAASRRFAEHLRMHDRLVSPVLRYLLLVGQEDDCDALWYEEQLSFLLERLLASHEAERHRVSHLRAVRARTRHEIHRRIMRATDFMLSHYEAALELRAMAEVACLEKHHFLKLFTMVHGMTPFEFLRRKRVAVALRLLRQTDLPHGEIARRAGLGTRHTLLRALKEFTGSSPQEYKRTTTDDVCGWHGELARLLEMPRVEHPHRAGHAWSIGQAVERQAPVLSPL